MELFLIYWLFLSCTGSSHFVGYALETLTLLCIIGVFCLEVGFLQFYIPKESKIFIFGVSKMKAVTDVLSFLENGNWLSFEDLKQSCSTPECQIKAVLDLLGKFDFLEYKPNSEKFRIIPIFASLLTLNK
jgi:hypothetical protein